MKKQKKQFLIFQKEQLKYCDFILFKYTINIKLTQYNTLNVKLSNSELNKLKSAMKNGPEVTLNLSSNITDDFNDENNFPHKFLLTNTQVSKLHKAFSNNYSANTKLSKMHLHKIGQLGGFLGRLLVPLLNLDCL